MQLSFFKKKIVLILINNNYSISSFSISFLRKTIFKTVINTEIKNGNIIRLSTEQAGLFEQYPERISLPFIVIAIIKAAKRATESIIEIIMNTLVTQRYAFLRLTAAKITNINVK